MLCESLHINGGVVCGNHEVSLLLLLFVLKEQVLGEDSSLGVGTLELNFLEHLWDSEDGLVSDGGKGDAMGGEILLS
jgi:hypothetical protein